MTKRNAHDNSNASKDTEKLDHVDVAGGNVKRIGPSWNDYGWILGY